MENSICDTDIIVKISKSVHVLKFFDKYKVVHFSDCVLQEIERNAKSKNIKSILFKNARININKNIEENLAKKIHFRDLSPDEKQILRREFLNYNIVFDECSGEYKMEEDIGEKVTIIYAELLGIQIILSDDNRCKSLIARKPRLKIRKLVNVLKELNIKDIDLERLRLNSDHVESFDEDYERVKSGKSIKNLANIALINLYKRENS